MHTLFGITLVLYLLKLSAGKGFCLIVFSKYRLSYERRGDISFIAKYDIVTRAIKLILPSLECDNLFITYLCLYLEQKPDYIFKLFILREHFKMNSKFLFKIR